jgi:hypothetical protein
MVKTSRQLWEKSSWTARQVAAVVPLMPAEAREVVVSTAATNGMLQALQVLASTFSLRRMTTLDRQLRSYLGHPSPDGYPYPLQKVIVAKTLLEGSLADPEKAWLKEALANVVHDPIYRRMLHLPSKTQTGGRRATKTLQQAIGFAARC